MRNLILISVIGLLTLVSCKKDEFEEPYKNHIYTGYGIIGNGSNCTYTLDGIEVNCEYHVRVRVIKVDGRIIKEGEDVGVTYGQEVNVSVDKSQWPLLEGDTLNFKYDKILNW